MGSEFMLQACIILDYESALAESLVEGEYKSFDSMKPSSVLMVPFSLSIVCSVSAV